MGTTAHVIVTDGALGLADRAVARLEELEARWSRFRPDSEISRLNERPGVPVVVSPDTYQLIERALDGWRLTAGRFDPTLLRELRAAGYDRSFELLPSSNVQGGAPSHRMTAPSAPPLPSRSGAEQIRLDPIAGAVWLGPGVEIDPGGIGKGLAADLVVGLVLAEGARGALVNVGGDLRAEGVAPEGDGWVAAIADPNDAERVVGAIAMDAGAVASTWRTKRAWSRAGRYAATPSHRSGDRTPGRERTRGRHGHHRAGVARRGARQSCVPRGPARGRGTARVPQRGRSAHRRRRTSARIGRLGPVHRDRPRARTTVERSPPTRPSGKARRSAGHDRRGECHPMVVAPRRSERGAGAAEDFVGARTEDARGLALHVLGVVAMHIPAACACELHIPP